MIAEVLAASHHDCQMWTQYFPLTLKDRDFFQWPPVAPIHFSLVEDRALHGKDSDLS